MLNMGLSEMVFEASYSARSVVGKSSEVIDMLTRVPKLDVKRLSQELPEEFVEFTRALSDLRDAQMKLENAALELEATQ